MEEDRVIDYLYKRLKNRHLWFVTKKDTKNNSWIAKPKKYYDLDEYGELKNKSKVAKEITDYIGDGANTLFEAVSLFIEDGISDGSILTNDYLDTEFKDKPVEYTDTAVEVNNIEPKYIKPEITGSNKQVESKQLEEENIQRRLEEENNKSLNLISDMFKSKDFDSDSKAGQIVMRTSNLFNILSDKGYDVQVSFDNGESTNTILLGQQGGSILITITDTNQPLKAFTDGSFEITEDNVKILDDVRKEIETI